MEIDTAESGTSHFYLLINIWAKYLFESFNLLKSHRQIISHWKMGVTTFINQIN